MNHEQAQISRTLAQSSQAANGLLQRQCACGGQAGLTGACNACSSRRLTLQRRAADPSALTTVPPLVLDVLRAPGEPLDRATRALMESRFGHDFSQVRVHTDARAAESAQSVHALAYTVGQDVVFGAGQYAPQTLAGEKLLAHELTHTIQQQSASGAPPSTDPHGIYEASAEAAGRTVASGGRVSPTLPACGIGLSRTPAAPDALDKNELARQLQEVTERLKQPAYPGRDRDLAVKEALLTILDSGEKEDEDAPVGMISMDISPKGLARPVVKPVTKSSVRRNEAPAMFSPGGFTDQDIDRLILESEDDEYKKYKQEEAAKEQQRKIREEVNDETRHDRFMGLRKLLEEHGFRRGDLADHLIKYYSMRDLQILRRYGLEWPRRGPSQSNLEEAIDRYDYEWRKARGMAGPYMKELTQADQQAMEERDKKNRILKAQLEGLSATTGSFLGAVSGGVARWFTDDEEKIAAFAKGGAVLEGIVTPFAQAAGQRGSYVPQVENAPFNPYGAWRYSGPAPAMQVNTPTPLAVVTETSPIQTMPQVDVTNRGAFPPAPEPPSPTVTPPAGKPVAADVSKDAPMRRPPGGGDRAGMTATEKTLTPHKKLTPVVEVLPRTTVPMKDFEPPEPGHYIRRKPPSAETQRKILERAGHTSDGRLRDANTGRALEDGEAVWGHAPNYQFKEMRDMAEKLGWTQEEFDKFFEDPAKWQVEYGPSNSSRVFDRIPRQRPVH